MLRTEPADLCPLGHGPMWYWPAGGEWACQRPTCQVTDPVPAYMVLEVGPVALLNGQPRIDDHWLRRRYMFGYMNPTPSALLTANPFE